MASVSPRQFVSLTSAIVGALALAAPLSADILEKNHPAVRAAISAQREVTSDWMRAPEVLGTAVTVDPAGATALTVYVDRESDKAADRVRQLPTQWRGVAIQVHLTDKFRAMRRHRSRRSRTPPPPPGHRAFGVPPIQLGTSGGSIEDSTRRFCCGGTLGALVQIAGQQYILSNFHVFEADTVAGTNGTVATTGDAIVQPALIDSGCDPSGTQRVGTLETRSSLPGSNVDCAIARVNPGMVRADGSILEIGTISSQTAPAFINQPVKKSGRTTGLTHTSVTGLNATIKVDYSAECGGSTTFTQTFTGQIVVANRNSTFLGDGDSGSLLVEDVATNPRAVGLLFAGGTNDAIANPINEVLDFLGASMVGN